MSFTIPAGFKAELASGRTRLNGAVRLVRRDGVVYGGTDARLDTTLPELTVGSQTVPETLYKGMTIELPTNLQQTDDPATVDNWELRVFLGDYFTKGDLALKKFSGAKYTLILFSRTNLTWQMLRSRGTVGEQTLRGQDATWKMRGLSQALQTEVLDLTSPLSRAQWGDGAMEFFDLDGNTHDGYAARVSGTVSAIVDSRRAFTVAQTAGFPAGRFTEGTVEWVSGDNAGGPVGEIMDWDATTGALKLWYPTDFAVQSGDSVVMQIKAPKTVEEWIVFFGDATLFPGEPQMMTLEEMYDVNNTEDE